MKQYIEVANTGFINQSKSKKTKKSKKIIKAHQTKKSKETGKKTYMLSMVLVITKVRNSWGIA